MARKIIAFNGGPRKTWNTLQFDDYSKYEALRFDPKAKAKRHAEISPEDCARARELGVKLVAGA